jgi:hypothetical protein
MSIDGEDVLAIAPPVAMIGAVARRHGRPQIHDVRHVAARHAEAARLERLHDQRSRLSV